MECHSKGKGDNAMTPEEKAYSAIMALRMIARQKLKTTWVERSYNNGHDEPCPTCKKLIEIASIALDELEKKIECKNRRGKQLVRLKQNFSA